MIRKKSLRKFVVLIITCWIIIVSVGIIFSHSIQDKIIKILSDHAGKYLSAEIHVKKSDIKFSVLKKFPLASIELRNVCVKIPPHVNLNNVVAIKGDTLLCAHSLFLQLDLPSLLNKKYDLRKISVNNGYIQIISDKYGNSSLDILNSKIQKERGLISTEINSFSFTNLMVYSYSHSNQSQVNIKLKKGNASGTFLKDKFSIKLRSNGIIEKFRVKTQEIEPYQRYSADIVLNKTGENYTIKKGVFKLSNIPFKIVGSLRTGAGGLLDIILTAQKVPLKQIDHSVLSKLINNNKYTLKEGTLDIRSTIKGNIRYSLPSIRANFKLINGKVLDNTRDIAIDNIYLNGKANNGKEHMLKSTSILVDSLYFTVGNSIQWGKISITNLITPELFIMLKGEANVIDLKSLINVAPLEILEGSVKNHIYISGTIDDNSNIKHDRSGGIKTWGNLKLQNFNVRLPNLIPNIISINGNVNLLNDFSLNIVELNCLSGNSDINLKGSIKNFACRNKIRVFKGTVYSKKFYVTEFFDNNEKEADNILFPDSIIIDGKVSAESLYFGKFNVRNLSGDIYYNPNELILQDINLNGFSGNIYGDMSISQKKKEVISMNTNAALLNVDIKKLFYSFNNFGQKTISAENIDGRLTGKIEFSTKWTNTLKPITKSIHAQNTLTITNGELIDYAPLMGLSHYINIEELRHVKFNKLETNISIRNEKVYLDQTNISSSAITFDGSGVHGFDNKYEYRLQLGLSDILWKKARKKRSDISEFGYIVEDGVGHTKVPVIISGKGKTYNVKFDKKTARISLRNKFAQEKSELKKLFENSENDESVVDSSQSRLSQNKGSSSLRKTDSGTYRNTTNEFILEWDDSKDDNE